SSFPYPNTTDFYNKEIDLTKTKGRTVYMFLYAPEDAHLDHNFLNWNSFYLKHRGEDARFITIGLGTDRVRAVFQEVFIKSQIAGSHLSTSPKEARKLLKDLSIGYVPKVIKVDENGNIISFNVDANLQEFNPFENISLVKIWQKELAQRF
ncbi:hypothetical protein FNJ87_15135, partial [Nonlabens mediterrranea]|nr:hypothetical protein [Nonlabens mediterrranea]